MAEVKTETKMQEKRENPRDAIREKRAKRLKLVQGEKRTVKVYAGNGAIAGILRHPLGKPFRDAGSPAEWPLDSFTTRRIADGSVRTDGAGPAEAPEADPTKNAREQAAAKKPQPKSESKPEPKPDQKPHRQEATPAK